MQIELQNVSFEYQVSGRLQPTLRDVSLLIKSQEFVAIVGPSGCGKSTLLNLIGGFLRPSSGKVLAGGMSVIAPGADRIMIFQRSGLFPFYSIAQNIEYGLKIRGISPRERHQRSEQALEAVHLSDFANAFPKQLSEGMKKLAEVARALVLSAPVLLFDESLAGLDALTRCQMQQQIQDLHELNRGTVIWVTHDLEEAVMLADRVVVLTHRPGRLRSVRNIPLVRPRTEEMRTSSAVQALRHELFESLSAEEIMSEVK